MSTGTLNEATCINARVHLPDWGFPFADVELDREVEIAGAAELAIADFKLKGTIIAGGPWMGRSTFRLVGGAGGWAKKLKEKGYTNDAGVKISKVISDAAAEAGETVADIPSGVVGAKWERLAGPASLVLHQLTPQAFYVDEAGVTRFGRRARRVLADPSAARATVNRAAGFVTLMAGSIAALTPGVIVEGIEGVDVLHELEGTKLRSTIWGSAFAPTSKRLAAWAKLFEMLDPLRRYRGTYEFRIVAQNGERLDLQPVRVSLGLPNVRNARVCPGVAGCRADYVPGAKVLVVFANSDPSDPRVVAFADAESAGFMPTQLELGADGPTLGVARITDTVQAGPFAGVITSASVRVKAGL